MKEVFASMDKLSWTPPHRMTESLPRPSRPTGVQCPFSLCWASLFQTSVNQSRVVCIRYMSYAALNESKRKNNVENQIGAASSTVLLQWISFQDTRDNSLVSVSGACGQMLFHLNLSWVSFIDFGFNSINDRIVRSKKVQQHSCNTESFYCLQWCCNKGNVKRFFIRCK